MLEALVAGLVQALVIAFGVAFGSVISFFLMKKAMKSTAREILASQYVRDFGEVALRVKQLLNDEGLAEDIREVLEGLRVILKELAKTEKIESELIKLPEKRRNP